MLSCFSHVQLFATLQNVAHQAPMSKEFSRQEYWSGLPCPPPETLPDPGIKRMSPSSPALQADYPSIHLGSPVFPYRVQSFYLEAIIFHVLSVESKQ